MSSSSARQQQKFRPYLTMQQIRYFIELADADQRSETEHLRLKSLRELKLFAAKNDLGLVSPALTTVGRQTVEDKLGLGSNSNDATANLSLTEQREQAYNLWRANPQLCTEYQIKLATLYRYENDLMSPDEEAAYEATL